MRRALFALVTLALVAAGAAIATRPAPAAAVYTVAQVRAGLASNSGAWIGRMVLVRGLIMQCRRVEGCSAIPAGIPRVGLVDGIPIIEMPRATVLSQSLPLQIERDPLRDALRRVPLLGRVVPPPRRLSLAQPATYPVRLVVLRPCTVSNSRLPCVAAVLSDTVGG